MLPYSYCIFIESFGIVDKKGERYWLSNKEGEICIIANKGTIMYIVGMFQVRKGEKLVYMKVQH